MPPQVIPWMEGCPEGTYVNGSNSPSSLALCIPFPAVPTGDGTLGGIEGPSKGALEIEDQQIEEPVLGEIIESTPSQIDWGNTGTGGGIYIDIDFESH